MLCFGVLCCAQKEPAIMILSRKNRAPLLASALLLVVLLLTAAIAIAQNQEENLRMDGGDELGWDISNWFVQVDGVMGGDSEGELMYLQDNAILQFSGDIVTEGGGFSNVRKRMDFDMDLSSYAGIVIEMEPHAYQGQAPLGMHLEFNDESSEWGYAGAFAVPLADSMEDLTAVYIPMDHFDRASRGGRVCQDSSQCTLDPARITEMELGVRFQEGPFSVNFYSITAVQNATSFTSPSVTLASSTEVQTLIQATTSSGGAVYNSGYTETCNAMYRSTLNTLLASTGGGVTEDMKAVICEGLQSVATLEHKEKDDTAWALRGTLDAIWEMASMEEVDVMLSRNASSVGGGEEELCMAVTSHPPVYLSTEAYNMTGW